MFKRIITYLLFTLLYTAIHAQDGKIIEQKPYFIPDSVVTRIQKVIPHITAIVQQVNFFRIVYLSDGLKVTGYMCIPKKAGKYPCVIVNRGGNREFGAINNAFLLWVMGETASWGYIVVGSQYRGNDGGEGVEEFGGKEVNDITNLIPLLASVKNADTSRIGMVGWSRGGMMTYLALTKTCRLRAAVVGSGMANGFTLTKKRPEMDSVFQEVAPGYLQNRDSVLKTRSAVYFADKLCPTTPLLLLTGSADWRVPPDEQLEMLQTLYSLKRPVRFAFFEGGQHNLIEHNDEVNHDIKLFLDQYVRDGKKWPNLEPHGN